MGHQLDQRYARNGATLSSEDQLCLHRARVCQFGLGGLGGSLLEMLARMGFGRQGFGWLRAADGDVFEASNLNRQLFCQESTLGRPKAEAAAERIQAVNSEIDLTTHAISIAPEHMAEFMQGADIVLDALGDLPSKLALRGAARLTGLPVITAAVAGWTGFITTLLPTDSSDGLLQALFSQGEGAENALGTLAPSVWLIATLQCREAVAMACGHPLLFHNAMHIVDLGDASWERIALPGQ